MALPQKIITTDNTELTEPYLLRVSGWTEERFFAEAPESRYAEFEDGELIMPSPVSMHHQDLVGFLAFLLRGYVEAKALGRVFMGPAVVRLRPGLMYEPDIFVVAQEHLSELTPQYLEGPPAMVVEIISPGGRSYDLQSKAANYRNHGVPEYWAIDPDAHILYRHQLPREESAPYIRNEHSTGHVASTAIPEFRIEADWLWHVPLPAVQPLLTQILQHSNIR